MLPLRDGDLILITGNFQDQEDIENTVKGTDVVVSLLGQVMGSPINLQSKGIEFSIQAMKTHSVPRIISLTGGGVRDMENDRPGFPDRIITFVMKNLAGKGTRNALIDGIRHAEIIREFEGDWTIVRGPMLTEKPATGKISIGNVGTIKGFQLTREDLADFLINEIEENKYSRKMPFLTNG